MHPQFKTAAAVLVAAATAFLACGPKVAPKGPGTGPTSVAGPVRTVARPPLRQAAIGEMCLDSAAGRPALAMVVARRSVDWTARPEDLAALVGRGAFPTFTVLTYHGTRAGTFTVAGAVDLGANAAAALGGYAGSPPCPDDASRAECRETRRGCGLAVAEAGEESTVVEPGGACLHKGRLVVDLGGGTYESFSPGGFLDELRAPAEEVMGEAEAAPACTWKFALANVLPGTDEKSWRGLDLVGVLDLDGDGRRELVLQYRYGSVRTWAVYSATAIPSRLEMVAEAAPWGSP